MAESDIKANTVTSTGTVVSKRSRIRGLYAVTSGTTAATITFKDGGSGGTTVLDLTSTTTADNVDIIIPGRGILCGTDIHVTLANVDSLTVFYE
jgi:hypothetical protein